MSELCACYSSVAIGISYYTLTRGWAVESKGMCEDMRKIWYAVLLLSTIGALVQSLMIYEMDANSIVTNNL